MDKTFLSKYLPLILLGALLLAGLVTLFTQADNYGITLDEPSQEAFGHSVMEWYYTFGRDKSFLTAFPTDAYVPEHGYFFDAVIAAVQQGFPPADHWHVREIVSALGGWLGLIAIALCAYELGMGSYWMAFLAALALWLYPRYYGAIYNNSKDIPAAVTTMFVLWTFLIFIKQWEAKKHIVRNSVLIGFFLGLAASIRVTAVIWYGILGLIVLAWWLLQGKRLRQEGKARSELIQQVLAACIVGLTSLMAMMAFWPYIFLNPLKNLFYSIKVMSQYPWNGLVLFNGARTPAMQLPRTYAPEWLVIGSPPALIIFALLGFGVACLWMIKKRTVDPRLAVVLLSFLVPLGAIVGLHSVVYDTLRQFLFLVPSVILVAVYGFVQIVHYLGTRKQKAARWVAAGLVVLTLTSYALVFSEMIQLSPFEYTYFSPVVGGLSGAEGKFDTDYWDTCGKSATQWLMQHYHSYISIPGPTIEAAPASDPIAPFLLPAFHEVTAVPDFYIASTRDNMDQQFPTYKVIYTVAREGVPFCVVKVNPALSQ